MSESVAPGSRPKRSYKPTTKLLQTLQAADSDPDTDSPQRAPAPAAAAAGAQGRRAAKRAREALQEQSDSDFGSQDAAGEAGSSESEDGAREEEEDGADEHEQDDEEEGEQGLAAPLDKDTLHELSAKVKAKRRKGTRTNYNQRVKVFEEWCRNGGYVRGERAVDPRTVVKPETAARVMTRFFTWYIAGRPGDNSVRNNGRKPKGDQLGRSACMILHSALQDYISCCCREAGQPRFELAKQPTYDMVFATNCSKVGNRGAGGARRYIAPNMAFTRDVMYKMGKQLLASKEPRDARNLSIILYQTATVSRGDDVRPRKLLELELRYMSSIGPSQCHAVAVVQAEEGGKSLAGKPGHKGIIRGKLPELCPLGALFRHLIIRFAIQGTPIPTPGTTDWQNFLLWPGRAGEEMTLQAHSDIMKLVFAMLGIAPEKVTHEMRVFAAQVMYEMGVSLEAIQRIGHWLLDSFGTAYIVPSYNPEALLALGFWPGAAQKDFTGYWAERFQVAVPEQLVKLLLPGLDGLQEWAKEEQAAAVGKRANRIAPEAGTSATVLRMGAVVVVQDALELATAYPDNPVHALLLNNAAFRKLHAAYTCFKDLGGFEGQRPLSIKEMLQEQTLQLQQSMQQAGLAMTGLAMTSAGLATTSAAAADIAATFNWPGLDAMQQQGARRQRSSADPGEQLQQLLGDLTEIWNTDSEDQRQHLLDRLQQRVAGSGSEAAGAAEAGA